MDALTLYRISRRFHLKGFRHIAKLIDKINFMMWGCSIPANAIIGMGTMVAYGGMGVVIHTHSKIGSGCLIGQGVTLGAKEAYVSRTIHAAPVIGDNVYIATGAKVLGGITVGSHTIIGANAVLLQSVPSHSVVAGIPARIVGQTSKSYRAIDL